MDQHEALKLARQVGARSPCAKSKRGVVVWTPHQVVATGFNAPPHGFSCEGSDACRAACGQVCVHAEQAAILAANPGGLDGAEMLHVKVEATAGGAWTVPGGGPSCVACSKLILEAGIAGMWLLEEREGKPTLVRYTADEFHAATLANLGLPPGR